MVRSTIFILLIGTTIGIVWVAWQLDQSGAKHIDRVKCLQEQNDMAQVLATFEKFNGIPNMAPSQKSMDSEIDALFQDSLCRTITPATIRQVMHDLNRRVP